MNFFFSVLDSSENVEKKKAFYEKYQTSGDTLSILLQKYLHFEVQSLMNGGNGISTAKQFANIYRITAASCCITIFQVHSDRTFLHNLNTLFVNRLLTCKIDSLAVLVLPDSSN